jgi:pyruvate dehydrogenase E2 component (dihydrolipoamide acetyltransferase)
VKWNFKEGDKLEEGDTLCEVETDKSTVGFEVTESFYLGKILAQEGKTTLKLGDDVALMVFKKEHVKELENYVHV